MKANVDKAYIHNICQKVVQISRIHKLSDLEQETVQLEQSLNERLQDNNLYLGIVGQFSTGKSTFINALLRDKLLKTDTLQGTTSLTTKIQYGSQLDVSLVTKSGKVETYRNNGVSLWKKMKGWFVSPTFDSEKDDIRHFIATSTSSDELINNIDNVTVYHPSSQLQNGLVIVDTPGINANDVHTSITVNAIKNVCDCVVFLFDINQPVSENDILFLKTHLGESLHRCIFLGTKFDAVNKRERERLLNTTISRLQNKLERENVICSAISALSVLNDGQEDDPELSERDNRQRKKDFPVFREQFSIIESNIMYLMSEYRGLIILENIMIVLSQLLHRLPDELSKKKLVYQQKHKTLMENIVPDIKSFGTKMKSEEQTKLIPLLEQSKQSYPYEFDSIVENISAGARSIIYAAEDKNELQGAVERAHQYIQEQAYYIEQLIAQKNSEMTTLCQNNLRSINEQFTNMYKRIQIVGSSTSLQAGEVNINLNLESNTQLSRSITNAQDDEEVGVAIGGGAGAFIGTLLLPGIGTVIGGALGAFFGSLFGPSLDELKSDVNSKLQSSLFDGYSSMKLQGEQALNKSQDELIGKIGIAIDRYITKYEKLVEKVRKQDRKEASRMSDLEKKVSKHTTEIQNLISSLEIEKEQLRQMNIDINKPLT